MQPDAIEWLEQVENALTEAARRILSIENRTGISSHEIVVAAGCLDLIRGRCRIIAQSPPGMKR